jgi:hypothetical protein
VPQQRWPPGVLKRYVRWVGMQMEHVCNQDVAHLAVVAVVRETDAHRIRRSTLFLIRWLLVRCATAILKRVVPNDQIAPLPFVNINAKRHPRIALSLLPPPLAKAAVAAECSSASTWSGALTREANGRRVGSEHSVRTTRDVIGTVAGAAEVHDAARLDVPIDQRVVTVVSLAHGAAELQAGAVEVFSQTDIERHVAVVRMHVQP